MKKEIAVSALGVKKKKIIFTVSTYYPKKDGVQFVTEYLAEGLAAREYDVTVITQSIDGVSDEEWHKGVHIIRFHIYTKHALHYGDIEKYKKYVLKISKHADILVNVCMQCAATDSILPLLKKISCRKILYMHGMYRFQWKKEDFASAKESAHRVWNSILWGRLYQMHGGDIRQYDKIIQIHRFDGAYDFIKRRYGIESIVIENACDEHFFGETQKNIYGIDSPYCICVANYLRIKNQIFSMRAFYQTKEMKDYGLIYIGSEKNEYYSKMCREKETLEKKYGKRNVQFLTKVARSDIPDWVRGASIYLLSSISEVFPVSLIESMAAGVPFIATDAGVARFLPGGVTVRSEREMSYWLALLAENKKCRDSLGTAGREYASCNFNITSKIEQLKKMIEEL